MIHTDSEGNESFLLIHKLSSIVKKMFWIKLHGFLPVLWIPVARCEISHDVCALRDLVSSESDVTQGLVSDGRGSDVGETLDFGQRGLGVG